MSLEHIPQCIWWPLGFLIVTIGLFVFCFTVMLGKAKFVEINLMQQVSLIAKYTDEQITINDNLQTIANQLETISTVKNVVINKRERMPTTSQKSYNDAITVQNLAETSLILKTNKQELETINSHLKQLKEQLIPKEVGN